MNVQIKVISQPRSLDALEELCRVARRQGFKGDAYVSNNGSELVVMASAEDVADVLEAARS